jgi:LacI family gluconate utilization system Gnt-I transcriptional repressor
VHGIADVLTAEGMQLLFGYTDYSQVREERLIETLLRRRPEGIIVTGGRHTPRARRLLEQAAIPVIETWDLPADPIDHVVGFSNAAASETMTVHLAAQGYRRIAFIQGAGDEDSRGHDRRVGYERAVRKLGLERVHVVSVGTPPITIAQGAPAVAQLRDEWPEVEAAICVSDLSAFGVITACHRHGWKVPETLAVAGFGDFEISRYCWPSITTVSVDCAGIGRQAGSLMLEAIAAVHDDASLAPRVITMPHAVIEREST